MKYFQNGTVIKHWVLPENLCSLFLPLPFLCSGPIPARVWHVIGFTACQSIIGITHTDTHSHPVSHLGVIKTVHLLYTAIRKLVPTNETPLTRIIFILYCYSFETLFEQWYWVFPFCLNTQQEKKFHKSEELCLGREPLRIPWEDSPRLQEEEHCQMAQCPFMLLLRTLSASWSRVLLFADEDWEQLWWGSDIVMAAQIFVCLSSRGNKLGKRQIHCSLHLDKSSHTAPHLPPSQSAALPVFTEAGPSESPFAKMCHVYQCLFVQVACLCFSTMFPESRICSIAFSTGIVMYVNIINTR